MFTHYVVTDSRTGEVLAWFPKTEANARQRAEAMAKDTGHTTNEAYWDRNHWVQDGPQELKDLLSLG